MTRLSAFCRLGWLWLPVLLVLLARAAVAPGWMVERDAGGTLTVRICSDVNGGGQTVDIPFERSAGHESDDPRHCALGALADAPPGPDVHSSSDALALADASPEQTMVIGFAPGTASPLPPSTGPPSFA